MTPDGTRIVALLLEPKPATLYVVSASLRTYLGLSRDGTYLHAIRPARIEDPVVGDGKRIAGELVCSCAGRSFGQRCYWTDLATALENGDRGFVMDPVPSLEAPAWLAGAVR